jgi:predicted XRE-type DNA-binding protein
MASAEASLREQVRAALAATGTSQAAVARQLEISQKYLSHMLTGRATLTLTWAERILATVGMRVEVAVYAAGEDQPHDMEPVEHCVHDRTVHAAHHRTPVDGCPWCMASSPAERTT